jgi:hypothetical protein
MTQEIPESIQADAARVLRALEDGGRAEITLRSKKTGAHVYLLLSCKKRRPEGKGYLPRNTAAGRVGYREADKVDAVDPDLEYPENRVGAYGKVSDRFYPEKGADAARVWAADHVISWALGAYPALDAQADVFLHTRCSSCGIKLKDPISITRGLGPECHGKATGSKKAAHGVKVAAPVDPVPAPVASAQGSLLDQVRLMEAVA